MGLDMYFYVENRADDEIKEPQEFSYYRKFNALQGYFEKNFALENCGRVQITKEIREDLLNIINEILEDQNKAEELLPVQQGFFYGTYEYDDFYFQDLYSLERDLIHMKFINYDEYNLYFTSNW